MTTVRELYEEAEKKGALDYDVVFEEEGQWRYVSNIEFADGEFAIDGEILREARLS